MKRVFLTCIVFSFTLTVGYGQTKNINTTTNIIENDYLSGLHKPTDEEKGNLSLQLTPNIDFYTDEGKKISFNELLPLLKSGNYTLEPYINNSNELKVAVLRPATKEETKEIIEGQVKNKKNDRVGTYAKPFNVTDVNGNKYSLEKLKGKIIVMNFWFVECKPCVMEIPDLNKLVEKYKDKEVVYLGFAINKTLELNSFLRKKEFKYHIIPDSREVINSYKISAYPTHIIINKNAEIVFSTSGLGPTTIADLEKGIEKLLNE